MPKAIGLGGCGRDAAERDACAGFVVDEEEQAGLRSYSNLSVIAGGFEGVAALGEGGVKLVGALDGGAQDGRSEAMEVAACGVDNEKTLSGEKSRVEIAEGLREGAAGFVSGHQCAGDFRGTEKLGGALDEGANRVIEDDAAGGQCGFGSLFVSKPGQFASSGKCDVIDLGEIVVLAGQPEMVRERAPRPSPFARGRLRLPL